MPNHVLKADCSAGDAWVSKSLSLTAPYKIQFDVFIPASTFTALGIHAQFTAFLNMTLLSGSPEDGTEVTAWDTSGGVHDFTSGNRNWTTGWNPGNPAASYTPGTWVTVVAHDDGTNLSWTYNGTTLFTYSDVNSVSFDQLVFGGFESNGISGEIYYIDNVKVYDSSDTLVFSDDFESGSLSAWDSTSGSVSIVNDPAGGGGTADFTIAASPAAFTFDAVAGGSGTSVISVGQVGSSETVNLTLDTSGLPSWISASLDVASVTTPGTAHVSITATADVPTGSWDITVTGTDSGSNTHSTVISVAIEVTGPVIPWDQSQPQQTVGTFPVQGSGGVSEDIWGGPFLLDHAGSLYLAWGENTSFDGPYVAVWTGSAWSVIGTGFETNGTALRTSPRLASDGTNLYLAYLIEQAQIVGNPCASGTIQVVGYSVRVWKYDGSTWTDLGTLASGSGPGDLPVTSMMGENGPGGGGIAHLKLSASSDEVGACYVALYEDGWVAASALGGHATTSCEAQRHLYVQGFGASTLGFVSLTSILLQPSVLSPHFDAPMFDYALELRGSGTNLTLYALQGDAYTGIPITGGVAHSTYWKVWQRGGFLSDLVLATTFGNAYYTLSNFTSTFLVVSDDQDGERLIFAFADYTDTDISGSAVFARTSDVASPETLGDADGHWQLNGPIGTSVRIVKQDDAHGDVWGYTIDGSQDGIVAQLADRCGVLEWQLIQPNHYATAGTTFTQTAFELFDDALYAVDLDAPAVVKLPLCRGCGICATGPGLHFWYRL